MGIFDYQNKEARNINKASLDFPKARLKIQKRFYIDKNFNKKQIIQKNVTLLFQQTTQNRILINIQFFQIKNELRLSIQVEKGKNIKQGSVERHQFLKKLNILQNKNDNNPKISISLMKIESSFNNKQLAISKLSDNYFYLGFRIERFSNEYKSMFLQILIIFY
ncbi:hypothetical protein TTHERM_000759119 (macronuclear) [Tetrahymena thermophila SB210]|uniref:Uncharacterized protein n=1 Tax=Tetrahymena thermophila (strain SB210) TaxID=312017 RepID=W7XC99_TETTS|nr:hypothetical protein TTHERM_000759119 [Tetrahymena thermophila SB210]EWS74163.1 hypothetical protein TTHERM_000759119 [Tetrahymena thermophila SB210]|eukprot:XP_012653303.1 hypothetical protein TTHERM_000759119 [Tetrahymena thermophila SB210]